MTQASRLLVAIVAPVLAASVTACSRVSSAAATAGFWFERDAFDLPSDATTKLGGPLAPEEIASIDRMARAEIERAFAGLRITIMANHDAVWRVAVVQTLQDKGPLPSAGQSVALGPLGGEGAVGFVILALHAIHYAPEGASRQTVIDGIGRGVGRAAAHEFAHQIAGAVHNDADENSYEHGRSDRPSQYYGDLHWTTALPALRRKIGAR